MPNPFAVIPNRVVVYPAMRPDYTAFRFAEPTSQPAYTPEPASQVAAATAATNKTPKVITAPPTPTAKPAAVSKSENQAPASNGLNTRWLSRFKLGWDGAFYGALTALMYNVNPVVAFGTELGCAASEVGIIRRLSNPDTKLGRAAQAFYARNFHSGRDPDSPEVRRGFLVAMPMSVTVACTELSMLGILGLKKLAGLTRGQYTGWLRSFSNSLQGNGLVRPSHAAAAWQWGLYRFRKGVAANGVLRFMNRYPAMTLLTSGLFAAASGYLEAKAALWRQGRQSPKSQTA